MDIELWVAWIQAAIWVIAVALWIFRQRALSPQEARNWLTAPRTMMVVVASGLIISVVSLRWSMMAEHRLYHTVKELEDIHDKIFVSEVIDIDGKSFRHCKFISVSLRYNGRAQVSFQDNEFSGTNHLISENEAILGAWSIAKGMGMMRGVPIFGPDHRPLGNIEDPKVDSSSQPQK